MSESRFPEEADVRHLYAYSMPMLLRNLIRAARSGRLKYITLKLPGKPDKGEKQ